MSPGGAKSASPRPAPLEPESAQPTPGLFGFSPLEMVLIVAAVVAPSSRGSLSAVCSPSTTTKRRPTHHDRRHNTKTGGSARFIVIAVLVVGAFFGAYQFASARSGRATAGAARSSQRSPARESAAHPQHPAAPAAHAAVPPLRPRAASPVIRSRAAAVSRRRADHLGRPVQGLLRAQRDQAHGRRSRRDHLRAEHRLHRTGHEQGPRLLRGPHRGSATVKLPALQKGEYAFSCGMEMVFGKIVVE